MSTAYEKIFKILPKMHIEGNQTCLSLSVGSLRVIARFKNDRVFHDAYIGSVFVNSLTSREARKLAEECKTAAELLDIVTTLGAGRDPIPGGWKVGMKCHFSLPGERGPFGLGGRVIGTIMAYDAVTSLLSIEHNGITYEQLHTSAFGGISGV